MPEHEPTNESEPMLSFEEFSARDENGKPQYKNFYMYFSPSEMGAVYRQAEHFQKFLTENSAAANELVEVIESLASDSHNIGADLAPLDRDLYEAYKIMKSYGVSDAELFT